MAPGHPVGVAKWERRKPQGAGPRREGEALTQAMDLRPPREEEGETEGREHGQLMGSLGRKGPRISSWRLWGIYIYDFPHLPAFYYNKLMCHLLKKIFTGPAPNVWRLELPVSPHEPTTLPAPPSLQLSSHAVCESVCPVPPSFLGQHCGPSPCRSSLRP